MLLALASPLVCSSCNFPQMRLPQMDQSLLAVYFEFIIEQFSFHIPTSLCQALRVVIGMSKQQGQAKRGQWSGEGDGGGKQRAFSLPTPPHIFCIRFPDCCKFLPLSMEQAIVPPKIKFDQKILGHFYHFKIVKLWKMRWEYKNGKIEHLWVI